MQQLRLFVVLFLMGAVPSTASVAYGQPLRMPAPQPADQAETIGPWFVAALPQRAPAAAKLDAVVSEAVAACPAKAVVCTPYASGGFEESQWNAVFAKRRLDACYASVARAGGTATTGGQFTIGPAGDHGRGVYIFCATVPTKAAFASMASADRPVVRGDLSPAAQDALSSRDGDTNKFGGLENPSYLILGLGVFGSTSQGNGASILGPELGLGWSKGRFMARANIGFGTSTLETGGIAQIMAGVRVTNWFDLSAGPVASASFADHFAWTAQYAWGVGLGLGVNLSVFRLQITPKVINEVDRYLDDPATPDHVGGKVRVGVDASLGFDFWY